CKYFCANFLDDWEELKPRLEREAASVSGGRFPLRDSVIQELLHILRYVDPYTNGSLDAPVWTRWEESRRDALQNSMEILRQLGRPALQQVWEALVTEV